MFQMNAQLALNIITLIVGLTILISSVEVLLTKKMYGKNQLLDWSQLRYLRKSLTSKTAILLFEKYFNVHQLLWSRLILSLALLAAFILSYDVRWVLFALFPVNVIFTVRSYYTNNGADQVINILLMSLTIAFCNPNSQYLKPISLNFIAIQIAIGYFVSGFFKINKGWLNGQYLISVMSTEIYGHKYIYRFLKKRQKLSALLSLIMIVVELSLAVAFLLPAKICLIVLCLGCLFHLCVAYVMGLNSFLTAFIATYPAIYYTSLHGVIVPTIKLSSQMSG